MSKVTHHPAESSFHLTDIVTTYVQQCFWWIVSNKPDAFPVPSLATPSPLFTPYNAGPMPPLDLPVSLVTDVELLATKAAMAFVNRSRIIHKFPNSCKLTSVVPIKLP